jgi:AGZA family xanthine/uracil permease-like MFS transporter
VRLAAAVEALLLTVGVGGYKCIQGKPITHAREIVPQFANLPRRLAAKNLAVGMTIFVIGLCKKMLLADNIGTLVAVGKRARLFDDSGHIPRVNRILTCDALATTAGSMCGTSTVVSYIESAAGVVAGGRSGVTAIVCGLLFAAAIFVAPMFGVIPAQATAPALIEVGALMLGHAAEIDWHDPLCSIPAFLTITAIPLTFSIANGLAFGFTVWTLLQIAAGRWRSIHWLVYVLTALFLARFYFLGKG